MPTWIRVRDTSTRHEFDMDERSLPHPGVEPIPDYPPNSGPGVQPRPAKHHTDKAGNSDVSRPATRTSRPSTRSTQ